MFVGRKLLVVDDSPYYRTVLSLTFTDEGMDVTTVGDGQDALESLDQVMPDVVLANVSMPGISGYELCQRIKQSERFGHIPVMLLVGLHELLDRAEARRVGADDVVTKPFKSIRELVGRVGSLLGGKPAGADDAAYEHSTLGLGRSDVSAAPVAGEQDMTEPNVKVFIEAPTISEHAPPEPVVEAAGNTCVADVALQTADTQRLDLNAVQTAATDDYVADERDVKVYVEAPAITEHEPVVEPPGSTCVADVALQTADTQQLQPIDAEAAAPISYAQDDTKELKPVTQMENRFDSPMDMRAAEHVSAVGASEMNEMSISQTTPSPSQPALNDALLDLDNFDGPAQSADTEDLILDLDYEDQRSEAAGAIPEMVLEPEAAFETAWPNESIASELPPVASTDSEQHVAELQEWAIVAEAPQEAKPVSVASKAESSEPGRAMSSAEIDAVARRVVEQLSEKVVREIAWEVVPELAELLIKKKLEEQK